MRTFLTLFLIVLLCTQGSGQSPLLQAFRFIQTQQYDSAIRILEPVTAKADAPSQAWLMLGNAYRGNGDLDNALNSYKKILADSSIKSRILYEIGVTYALTNDLDKAFDHLEEARKSGEVNMTDLGLVDDIKNLKSDPRYPTLLPSDEEYMDPFLEQTEIINDWHGKQTGDVFGWIARNIGDVDGDEYNDITTSAPFSKENGNNAGKIYVYSSKSGQLLWSKAGEEGAVLGLGVEAAGDVNNDNIPDVIAGAPGINKAFVYSGDNGALIHTFEGEAEGDSFGRRGKTTGDLNKDGFDDIIIGAPGQDEGGEDAGAAYVYSGKNGSLLLKLNGENPGDAFGTTVSGSSSYEDHFLVVGASNYGENNGGRTYVYKDLNAEPAFTIDPDSMSVNLGGMFISLVGDINKDGVTDVYASDWNHRSLGRNTGAAYIHSGKDGQRLYAYQGEAGGDGFGIGIGDAGDVNGDGYDDIVIGAWQHSSEAPSGGKIYLYSGKDGSLLRTYTGKVMGETLGFDATGIGDINDDGTPDLLVTSAYSAIKGARSGRMMIVSGK